MIEGYPLLDNVPLAQFRFLRLQFVMDILRSRK